MKLKSVFYIELIALLTSGLNLFAQSNRGATPIGENKILSGKTYAIIIGLSKYKNVINLQYADRDALAFRNYLVKNLNNPLDSNNIELFLNEDAGRYRISDAISNVLRKTKSGDRVYFYFAGHGDIEDLSQTENGLLLLYDSPNGNYFAMMHDVIQVSELSDYFGKLSEKGVDVIYAIDACHSGKLKGGVLGAMHTSSAISKTFSENSTVILSCQANQLSLESQEWGGGRGLFSYNLETGLRGAADFDKNGLINLFELERYVKDQTFIISEGKQIPVIDGDVTKILTIVKPAIWDTMLENITTKYKTYNIVNVKGDEWAYVDELDSVSKQAYNRYRMNLSLRKLIEPTGDNAIENYQEFNKRHPDNCITLVMKRNLAIYLNEKFDSLIAPLITGKKPVYTLPQCKMISKELEMCMMLLGKDHYMYNSIMSRKYYVDALIESFGININNYETTMESTMEKSIDLLKQSKQLEPNASYVYYMLGLTLQSMGFADSALCYFKKYLSLVPNSYAAHNVIAIAYADLGYWEESIVEFKNALKLNNRYVESYVNLSYVSSYFKKYDEAVSYLKKAIAINPEYVSIYNNLGSIYLELSDYKKTIEAWRYSIKLNPHSERPYFNLGNLYYSLGNYQLAEQELKRAIELKPAFVKAKRLLGILYMEQYKNPESLSILSNEIKWDSTNAELFKNLGIVYKRMNLMEKAEDCLSLAIRLSDGILKREEILADIYQFGRGDFEKAHDYYMLAIKADTLNSTLLRKFTLNLIYEGKLTAANESIEKYSKLFPKHIELYYLKACIFSLMGNYDSTYTNLDHFVSNAAGTLQRIIYEPIFDKFRNTSQFKKLKNKYS